MKRNVNTLDTDSIWFYLFLYAWIGYFFWPCSMYYLKTKATQHTDLDDLFTGRDIEVMYFDSNYGEMCELLEIGKKLNVPRPRNWQIIYILSEHPKHGTKPSKVGDVK